MCDLRNYSKPFVEEFITLYRNSPCLWRVKDIAYRNKKIRKQAYDKLVAKLKEVEPDANKELVIKKINSLRSAFRREFKKVNKSFESGGNLEDIYEPKLWYYDLLTFTMNQDIPYVELGNTTQDIKKEELEIEDDSENITQESENDSTTNAPSSSTSETFDFNKKRKYSDYNDPVRELACKTLERSEDDSSIFGRMVGNKLRKMNQNQKLFAEKMINEILFYGELGTLTLQTISQCSDLLKMQSRPNEPKQQFLFIT